MFRRKKDAEELSCGFEDLDGKDNGFGLNKRYLYFIVHFSNIGKVCSG